MKSNKTISTIFLLAFFFGTSNSLLYAKDKPAYKIFTGDGKEVDYDQMIKGLLKNQVIFFGELHNNSIAHWLQLEVTTSLYDEKKDQLILAAEMFEADDQIIIDEYLGGKISPKTLKAEAKLWDNYETDYKPLLDFAKANQLKFVCANIPRRYANLVYNDGIQALDALSEEAKKYIAPLPIPYDGDLLCYKEIVPNAGGHGGENLPKSQAIKDATMGWFLSKYVTKNSTVIHFNGSYHSDREQGAAWYVKQYSPGVSIGSITTKEQKDINKLEEENKNMADFIIVVPENMTKTY